MMRFILLLFVIITSSNLVFTSDQTPYQFVDIGIENKGSEYYNR